MTANLFRFTLLYSLHGITLTKFLTYDRFSRETALSLPSIISYRTQFLGCQMPPKPAWCWGFKILMKQKSRAARERNSFKRSHEWLPRVPIPLQSVLKHVLLPAPAEPGCLLSIKALPGSEPCTATEWGSVCNVRSCCSLLSKTCSLHHFLHAFPRWRLFFVM